MQKVDGIGGLFFRARDPATYTESPWVQAAGPTVFAPFPADTSYFGEAAGRAASVASRPSWWYPATHREAYEH